MLGVDEKKIREALKAEGVEVEEAVLKRVFRRIFNPAGCEKCGAVTKVAVEHKDGSLKTVCCSDTVMHAPKRKAA